MIKNIIHNVEKNIISTIGLKAYINSEIQVQVDDESLAGEARHLLDYLIQYLDESNKLIKANQTISYGSWVLKFVSLSDDMLEIWELATSEGKFAKGASKALRLWRDQNLICKNNFTDFSPPSVNMLVAISNGVLEGDPVEAVRYEVSGQMSGWYVTTDKYNNDIKTLKIEHIYHLILQRPDIAKYLALPTGFRFSLYGKEEIWLDQSIVEEIKKVF
jgi:hypothetical protein